MSVKRIDKYMNSSELSENAVTRFNTASKKYKAEKNIPIDEISSSTEDLAIRMTSASFGWSTEDKKISLKNISLEIPKNSLVAIVGQVGSGKSSLLSAILGEMEPMLLDETQIQLQQNSNAAKSQVLVEGTIAYAAQQAWIQNASLKNNILFR